MKKFVCLILVMVIIFCVCSCNESSNQETSTIVQDTSCTHLWNDATCIAPKSCSKCGTTQGSELGHLWNDATCTTPKTCSRCSTTQGNEVGHLWKDATCSSPKICSLCNQTEGSVGNHKDSGNGRCLYCNQDILLVELQSGFDVKLIIPTVGSMNGYCTVKYSNNTQYTISGDMAYLSANGKLLYNPSPEFTIEPGYYATVTHFRAVLESDRYNDKYRDLYLDNNSLAYTNVLVNGKRVFVRFGVEGPIAFGYSLADIGVY